MMLKISYQKECLLGNVVGTGLSFFIVHFPDVCRRGRQVVGTTTIL